MVSTLQRQLAKLQQSFIGLSHHGFVQPEPLYIPAYPLPPPLSLTLSRSASNSAAYSKHKVELNVDMLDPLTFRVVERLVREALQGVANASAAAKAASASSSSSGAKSKSAASGGYKKRKGADGEARQKKQRT